jgi:flap endonuclease-1
LFQFIDLCILLGCDYLEPIKGVGPKSALKLIREHGGLGEVLEHLRERYVFGRQSRQIAVKLGISKGGGEGGGC